ncbi:hypothetical protein APA386B_5P10 (plasmid) [Acetobacter pasteurianus 386B]|nr:hypothetical protein APA386B_5P10 [Acetobacter pasteurianus 386B]
MRKPQLTCYLTTNWRSYNAGLKKRGSLTVWFDLAMTWEGLPKKAARTLLMLIDREPQAVERVLVGT